MYPGLYGLQRFVVGFGTSYQVVAWGMTQSQIIALLGLAVAVPLGLYMQRLNAERAVVPVAHEK